MLSDLFALDRRLALANERVWQAFPGGARLQQTVDRYLAAYARFHGFDASEILRRYEQFSRLYSQHLKRFRETGRYPCQYSDTGHVDRETYDLALILSCVVNTPRFQILQHLQQLAAPPAGDRIGVLGAGSGIELEIISEKNHGSSLIACDLSFSQFVKHHFSGCQLLEASFDAVLADTPFNRLYAIELLEHLDDPALLLKAAYKSLTAGGQLVCTTATNMPQFDHLTNFTDIAAFRQTLEAIGFRVSEHREFKQVYAFEGVEARNDWFVLEKN